LFVEQQRNRNLEGKGQVNLMKSNKRSERVAKEGKIIVPYYVPA